MSSNITVQRICEYCGKSFAAKTTVTRYCPAPARCGKRASKAKIKESKIQKSNIETKKIIEQPIEDLKSREVLTVPQVASILGTSKKAVYNMINSGRLPAVKLSERTTRISRINFDKMMQQDFIPIVETLKPKTKPVKFVPGDWYSLKEILEKFSVSDSTLRVDAKREGIEKHTKGWFTYYRKKDIDKLFSNPPQLPIFEK
jgi:excisionase family DNA binding protein